MINSPFAFVQEDMSSLRYHKVIYFHWKQACRVALVSPQRVHESKQAFEARRVQALCTCTLDGQLLQTTSGEWSHDQRDETNFG